MFTRSYAGQNPHNKRLTAKFLQDKDLACRAEEQKQQPGDWPGCLFSTLVKSSTWAGVIAQVYLFYLQRFSGIRA